MNYSIERVSASLRSTIGVVRLYFDQRFEFSCDTAQRFAARIARVSER